MKSFVFALFSIDTPSASPWQRSGVFRTLLVLAFITALAITSGCANWNANNETRSRAFSLNSSTTSLDSVSIEIAVAQLDSDQATQLEQLLGMLDQQKLSLDIRQQLDRNGLVCGIMSSRPPAVFHELLRPFMPDPETLDIAARPLALAGLLDPVSRLLVHQRVSNRGGEAYPVGTSDVFDHVEWAVNHSAGQTPGEASQARCFFDITTYPNSNGSITLDLTPVIRHGETIPQIGVADGSFVMNRGQRQVNLDDVGFKIQLRVGQTLVMAATDPFSDLGPAQNQLGRLLLSSEKPDETRLLLVRLVQTQMDDSFDYAVK